jgi:regulator of sigma E protease
VQRYGRTLDVEVTPADEVETRELDVVEHVGRIGIGASFLAPVVGVPRPDTPAWRAGLRTFDRLTTVGGRKVERWVDLVDALAENRGDTVLVTYLRPVRSPDRLGGLGDFSVMEPGVATLTPASAGEEGRLVDYEHRAADVLARIGIEPSDMYVAFVPEGSSEYQAGLRAGDRIVAIDGTPQRGWSALKEELKRGREPRATP